MSQKLIAVIGATGQQGGAVVRALQASGEFKVRALTRNPGKHRDLAEEVVEADLDRPETLKAAFAGAHGVFLVTNFWEEGTDELKQATAALRATYRKTSLIRSLQDLHIAHCSPAAHTVASVPAKTAYLARRSITMPWADTVTEYSPASSFRSLWAQRSLACVGADFRPRSDQLTVIFAGVPPRLNSPMACAPPESGLAQASWSPDFVMRWPCLPSLS